MTGVSYDFVFLKPVNLFKKKKDNFEHNLLRILLLFSFKCVKVDNVYICMQDLVLVGASDLKVIFILQADTCQLLYIHVI